MYSIAGGALRGLKDTWAPLLFAGIAYWPISFALSYMMLAFKTGPGASGIWIGLSIGTAVYAILLVLRFQLLATRFALSEPASNRVRAEACGDNRSMPRGRPQSVPSGDAVRSLVSATQTARVSWRTILIG